MILYQLKFQFLVVRLSHEKFLLLLKLPNSIFSIVSISFQVIRKQTIKRQILVELYLVFYQ